MTANVDLTKNERRFALLRAKARGAGRRSPLAGPAVRPPARLCQSPPLGTPRGAEGRRRARRHAPSVEAPARADGWRQARWWSGARGWRPLGDVAGQPSREHVADRGHAVGLPEALVAEGVPRVEVDEGARHRAVLLRGA